MASLTIISSRNEDNSTTLTVTLPARRNGEVNFGALARINQTLLVINPEAFDPVEVPHPVEAPMPPALTELLDRQNDEPCALKAGEAYRGDA
jgi:hypothetical protein